MRSSAIDRTAVVDPKAKIADDAFIGPYCVIGPDVTIGSGCRLVAHVHVSGHTQIGQRTVVYPFASLGTPPQSVKYRGGPTRLVVGADCDIREGVTMNIGTEDDDGLTEVGDRCFFMANSHVAHDCKVGNDVTFANSVAIGGHVTVGDNVVFGGGAVARQFVRIGEGAMIAGLAGVRGDIIPYGLAQLNPAYLVGLNVVGLRRRGVSKTDIHQLRQTYRTLFFGDGHFKDRVEALATSGGNGPLVDSVLSFIRSASRPLTTAIHRADLGALS